MYKIQKKSWTSGFILIQVKHLLVKICHFKSNKGTKLLNCLFYAKICVDIWIFRSLVQGHFSNFLISWMGPTEVQLWWLKTRQQQHKGNIMLNWSPCWTLFRSNIFRDCFPILSKKTSSSKKWWTNFDFWFRYRRKHLNISVLVFMLHKLQIAAWNWRIYFAYCKYMNSMHKIWNRITI